MKYFAIDKNANVEVKGYKEEIDYGNNEIKFIVTVQDGAKKEYQLIINRNDTNKFVSIDNILSSSSLIYKVLSKIVSIIFIII